MENDDFSGVEAPDSLNLFEGEQPASTPEKPSGNASPDADADGEQGGTETPVTVKLGDEEFTEDAIRAALDDARNKSDWQKKNTVEAQRLAAMRKAIEPVIGLVKKLKEDGALASDIRDELVDRLGDEAAGLIDAALTFDEANHPNPFKEELETTRRERDEARAERDAERAISAELKELRKNYKLTESQADKVLEFATKKFEETKQALTLDDAYRLMEFEKLKAKSEAPKVPSTPGGHSPGARTITHAATSFDDIKVEDGRYSFFK